MFQLQFIRLLPSVFCYGLLHITNTFVGKHTNIFVNTKNIFILKDF